MILALFDVDHTLIRGDSFKLFCWFALKRGGVRLEKSLDFVRVLARYAMGRADAGFMKASCLRLFLPQASNGAVTELADEFVERVLMTRLSRKAAQRLRWHKEQNHRVVLLSASPDFYLSCLAARLGADDVICTRTLSEDGSFAGALVGENCKGDEKRRRLISMYSRENVLWRESYGYGNSVDDIPFMEIVGHPQAVNPDAKLKENAARRGWEVVEWQ